MSLNSESKPWWETQLEWNLAENLQNTLEVSQRILKKNIPSTMSAHRLNKPSKIYDIELDPVEKIKYQAPNAASKPVPPTSAKSSAQSPVKPAAPKPRVPLPPRAVNMPSNLPIAAPSAEDIVRAACDKIVAQRVANAIDANHLTLAQLLDPDFCDYT